jgi:transposase
MSTKRFTEEFKVEAVGQVVDKGYRVADVVARLGVSQHSLYQWIKQPSSGVCPLLIGRRRPRSPRRSGA